MTDSATTGFEIFEAGGTLPVQLDIACQNHLVYILIASTTLARDRSQPIEFRFDQAPVFAFTPAPPNDSHAAADVASRAVLAGLQTAETLRIRMAFLSPLFSGATTSPTIMRFNVADHRPDFRAFASLCATR